MNNKKYLSVFLFGALMLGTAGTFTGCIDNDEPAGIEELRGAKAELLRAKVAVETAIAARENANATLILAQAETEKANAAYQEALAEQQKLQNERLAARTEAEKAEIEVKIAQLQQKMEEDALAHQQKMVELQQSLAEAQRSYELALKAIEIAEAIVSDQEKVTLTDLKDQLETAQSNVNTAARWVESAQKDYYNALIESQNDSVAIKRQELNVRRAEADLATKQEILAKWNSFQENDTETADWRKEITELEDSIEGIERQYTELGIEKVKVENSDEYKALLNDKDYAKKLLDGHVTSAEIKYSVWANDAAHNNKKEFLVAKGSYYQGAINAIDGTDETNGYIDQLNAMIAGYTSQKKALLDEIAADQKATVENAKKASDAKVKAWQDAKTKYEAVGSFNANTASATVEAAQKAFDDAIVAAEKISDAQQKANAQALAYINYAKALVAYYTEVDKYVGCKTREVTLSVTQPDGTKKDVKKTILEWLSDANYSGVYLSMIIDKGYNSTALRTFGPESWRGITKMGTVEDLLNALVAASDLAFGKAEQYQSTNPVEDNDYMRVQPTEDEVKAIENYQQNCGALGYYYYVADPSTQYEALNYKTIIAEYEKALAYFTEASTNLKDEHKKLQTAFDEAKAAVEAFEEENINILDEEMERLTDRWDAWKTVKSQLVAAVNKWLPENNNYTGTESFEAWLNDQITKAENAVIKQEEEVVAKKVALEKMKDGKYDTVSYAKEELDKAMAALEAAQAELETATENLKTALEIMAKE